MPVKKDINSDIEALLVSNGVFEYAHLIKFERPNAPDNLKFRTNANRYAYFTDASRDLLFDDATTDQDGNANGAQIYRANRVKSVGSYSETIQAKATSMNLVLGAEHLNTSVSVTGTLANAGHFTYSSGFSSEEFDFVELGFREGDLVSFTRNDGTAINDGNNSTASPKYIITGFTNSNQKITLARTGNDTVVDFFDAGFPSSDITTAFTISLESDELRGVLAIESNTLSTPTFFNREVFIYKVFINPETGVIIGSGDTTKINGILVFKGIISSCSLNEKDTGSTVTWALTSHWGDFYERKGRITSDAAHRGLDSQMRPNPQQALRPLHAGDLGFLHAETSLAALAEYQRVETRKEYRMLSKKAGGLRGLAGGKNYYMEEVEVEDIIDEQVKLDLGLAAANIPLVYGVRRLEGIPVFADTLNDDPREVHVVYALAEGEMHGLYNLHIDGVSTVCTDQSDYNARNGHDGTAKDESKMVCYGRMARGETIVGLQGGGTSPLLVLKTAARALAQYPTISDPEPEPITPLITPTPSGSFSLNMVTSTVSAGGGFSFSWNFTPNYTGLWDWTKMSISLPNTKISNTLPQARTPQVGDSSGLFGDGIVTLAGLFGNQFDMSLTFMNGSPDQPALNNLVANADNKRFKRQNEYFTMGTRDLPYWSNNHRLLDTAYVHVRYEMSEEMTELPELEYTLRGKVYENYNYDNTYVPDPATNNFTPRSGSTNDYRLRENDIVNVEVSFNNGTSFETARTSSGGTNFRIMDVYEVVNHENVTQFKYRLDETPFYKNDGSTKLSPNGFPTFDKIRLNKSGTTWTMLPWNAGPYKTPTAFPSQKKDVVSFGFSAGKLRIATSVSDGNTLATTGDVFQLMPRVAGGSLTGDLQHFDTNVFRASHSSGTFTLTDTQNYTSNPTASPSDYSIQSARRFNFTTVSGFTSLAANEVEGQYLKIIETGEERKIMSKNNDGTLEISSPFAFPPDSNNTFTITGAGRDRRAGTNPAMQLLDYMTNQIYGKDLDLETDIDLESFTATAKLCDTRSDVTIKITSGTPTIGNRYVFNPSNLNDGSGVLGGDDKLRRGPTFSGKVKAFDSTNNYVTFTECTGKIYYNWNDYRTFDRGDVIASRFPTTGSAIFSQYIDNESGVLPSDPADNAVAATRELGSLNAQLNGFRFSDGSSELIMDTSVEPAYSLYDSDFIKYWRYSGWEHHHQRWVTRHQTNFIIDTSKAVFENVNLMLQHFNGILSYENGNYILGIETQEDAPVSTKTFNGTTYNENVNPYFIEHSDIIGDIKLTDNSNKNSKNLVKATVPDPALGYDNRNISFLNSNYLKADRNVRKSGSLSFSGITNYFNGRINAEKYLTGTRYGKEITFKVGQRGLLMKPGQVLGLTYEPFGFTNKLFRIQNLNFNADCTTSIKAIEYDDSVHFISAQQKTKLFSENTGTELKVKAPGAPTNFTISELSNSPGMLQLSWTNATDFREETDFTEVWHDNSSQNNRSIATRIATVKGETFNYYQSVPSTNNFFWVRHKRIQDGVGKAKQILFSAYNPTSANAGTQITPIDLNLGFVKVDKPAVAVALDTSGNATTSDITITNEKTGFGDLSTSTEFRLFELDGTSTAVGCTFNNGSTTVTGNSATLDASTFTSTTTPKLIRARTTVGQNQGPASGRTFDTFSGVSITKSAAAAARTTTGVVYYNVGSQNAPAGPDANNDAVFTFSTGAFTNLDSGWQTTPPTANPSDANAKYWLANFTAVENISSGVGTGTSSGSNLTFTSASQFINFTNTVVFSDLSTSQPTTTIINGDNITTGTIQSANFTESGGNVTAGTKIILSDGQIDSKEFSINSSGDATFSGNLSAATGTFAGNISAASGTFTGSIAANSITASSINIAKKAVGNSGGFVKGATADKTRTPPNASGSITGFVSSTYVWGPVTINGVSTNATIVDNMQFTTGDHGNNADMDYIFSCTINPVGLVYTNSQRYFSMLIAPTGTHSSGNDTYLGSSGYPTSSIIASQKRFFSGGLPGLTSATLTAIAPLGQNTTYTAVLYGLFYLMGTSPGGTATAGFPASGQERGFGPVSISVHGMSF